MLEWMINEKGCYWEKVCADPGDLILWDSRTVHYGSVPLSKNARVATYVCYKPAALASPETYEAKKKAFENLNNCTHDPTMFQTIVSLLLLTFVPKRRKELTCPSSPTRTAHSRASGERSWVEGPPEACPSCALCRRTKAGRSRQVLKGRKTIPCARCT